MVMDIGRCFLIVPGFFESGIYDSSLKTKKDSAVCVTIVTYLGRFKIQF